MLVRKSLMKILREYHRLYREFMKNIFRKKCKLQGFGKTIKSVPYKYLICFGIIKKIILILFAIFMADKGVDL